MSTSPESAPKKFQILASPEFPRWLQEVKSSIAFSTYQLGKILFLGMKQEGRLAVFERTFNRCMGLWSDTQTLWLASAFQMWRMENMVEEGKLVDGDFDRLFVPQQAVTTGDIDVHDLTLGDDGELYFVNTLFCCLSKFSPRFSFEPVWRPPFVSRVTAEDRCHLNGLASRDGKPRYVTACSQTDSLHGWREHRQDGGCVIDINSNEIITTGLSMPHSPRFYRDQLWLVDSGNGYFGNIDLNTGKFQPLVFCPGYARGLGFVGRYAIVGLSKPRESTFAGLALDQELQNQKQEPKCGLLVIDLERAAVVHWLQIEGNVEELYDVIVLPGVRRAKAFGLKTDEIRHNTWFENEGQVVRFSAAQNS